MSRPLSALLIAVTLTGCVHTRVGGRLSIETASPAAAFAPERCWSGAREYFYGVDLASGNSQARLRVLLDPLGGPVLKLSSGGGVRLLSGDKCSVLKVDLKPTGWRVNGVRDFSGTLSLDCEPEPGTHIQGDLSFTHCH